MFDSQEDPKSGAKAAQNNSAGNQQQRGSDSLVLTKFDILEAFKGHGDLVSFLQERVCSKQRVATVKTMLLEAPGVAQAQKENTQQEERVH